jgi:NADH-quinone oxidoreductase subunit L
MAHVHESPLVMLLPLYFLAIGAIGAGFAFFGSFAGEARFDFWGDSIFVFEHNDTVEAAHHVPGWVVALPLIVSPLGILFAWLFYIRARHVPAVIAGTFSWLHSLFYRKWYFDELYHAIGVVPSFVLGKFLWKTGDGKIIDGLGPDGIAKAITSSADETRAMQSGYVYHYAFAMLIGVVAIVAGYIFYAQ